MIHSFIGLDYHTYLKGMAGSGRMEQLFQLKPKLGLYYVSTPSVPPYMDRLFMPVTPVRQSNPGSVRKELSNLPEEAL